MGDFDRWGFEFKEVSHLGEELRPNEVEKGRILEAHRLEPILQQQLSQCMAPSHHDGNDVDFSFTPYDIIPNTTRVKDRIPNTNSSSSKEITPQLSFNHLAIPQASISEIEIATVQRDRIAAEEFCFGDRREGVECVSGCFAQSLKMAGFAIGFPNTWLKFENHDFTPESKKASCATYKELMKKEIEGPEALDFAHFGNMHGG
ncbi:hypothetical protein Tco_0121287 [Tanacetum coccineum]